MVYLVKYRPKGTATGSNSKLARTVFAESDSKPSRERAVQLLNKITGGDFLEYTIQIQELRSFDPADVRNNGGSVFSL
jgi:hypothetical protein